MNNPDIRLLFATAEPCPTFRVDVATLFGKYLPRLGVSSDMVTERAPDGAGTTDWPGGESLLISTRGGTALHHVKKFVHCAVRFLRADRATYQAIQVRDMPLVALVGLLTARLKGLPFFYWMSFPMPEGQIQLARTRGTSVGLVRFLFPWLRGRLNLLVLYRLVLPWADHVFVQSERMLEDLTSKGIARQRMTSVVMGVDLEIAIPEAIPPADDARLTGKRVLIYLGVLARIRQVELLFDMLRLVREQFPDVLLVLVGEAEDEAQGKSLRRQAEQAGVAQAAIFTGWLPVREAWRYVRAAEIGLAPVPRGPLLDCGSPTKVGEYLALGVPVVANDNPDQERVIREGGGGLCVPLTARDFAQAVSRLLADAQLRRAMGAAGQRYIRASRSYLGLSRLVASKYAELLQPPGERKVPAVDVPAIGLAERNNARNTD